MRIIKINTFKKYWEHHRYKAAEKQLKIWIAVAKDAKWSTPQELKKQFTNASIINTQRVVFNIKGNSFRLVVDMSYC